MKIPKVCITTLEFPPDVGGVGESVQRIAHLLRDLGYEVHVAVFHSKQRKGTEFRRSNCQTCVQDDITIHRLEPANRSDQAIIQDYLSEVYFLLKELHLQHQFDLFHAFFINETGFLTTLLAQEQGVPVINSVRGSDLHKHVFNPKHYGQMVWTLEQSAWVTFVSRDLHQRGCLLAPDICSKSSAFWNSIRPISFQQFPTPFSVNQLRGTVIGSVGRFRDKKGLEFLLDACAKLSPQLDLTLLLVGDFAERESAYWQQEIEQSGIRDRIIITGMLERTQALAFLPHIDIFTVPSLHDGCPNTLLEAMLAKRAIIGTQVDAIGEILEDGRDALVVSPGSSDELAEAIRWLAQSPDLRKKLGQAARAKVLKQLSPAVEQENWNRVYQRVLGITRPTTVAISS